MIKKISKKKIHPEDFANLETRLREGWIKQNGTEDGFDETWQMIQGCMSYGYCSMHGAAVGGDACYGLYLKAYYPLEYYTVCFNQYKNDARRTNLLKDEIKHFGITLKEIRFGYSKGDYTFDRDSKTIYKGIGGIKFLNDRIANELYEIGQREYADFVEVLDAVSTTSTNSKQLDILVKLDFFHGWGEPNEILKIIELYNAINGKKQFTPVKAEAIGIPLEILDRQSAVKTAKTYKEFDSQAVLRDTIAYYKEHGMMPETTIIDRVRYQQEHYGYIQLTIPEINEDYAYVQKIDGASKKTVTLYRLKTGDSDVVRIRAKAFESNEFEEGSIIRTIEVSEERKWKRDNEGNFYQIDDTEMILKKWNNVKC